MTDNWQEALAEELMRTPGLSCANNPECLCCRAIRYVLREAIRRTLEKAAEPEHSDEYFVMCKRSPSDYATFWRANRCGYTRRIDDAGRYSKQEAEEICRIRREEIMFPCGQVEKLAVRLVDVAALRQLMEPPK